MIPRSGFSEGPPDLYQPDDLRAVVAAVLEIVVRAWRAIRRRKLLTEEHRHNEPRTAGLLYHHLREQERNRLQRLPKLKLKHEVGTHSAADLEIPDGRIDIEVIYSLDDEPDLRLECKRVSASSADDGTALARAYVGQGIMRFVADKYGRGHTLGVLIAFVIDGLFAPAARLVADYATRDDPAHLVRVWQPAEMSPRRHLFQTEHRQESGSQIRLLHLFLPFPRRR